MPSISGFQPASSRINGLQILRAFAALAVVEFHTGITFGHWHVLGAFGVDIFFVLSGFVMAMVSLQERNQFFARRLIRILPPYWTFTLITFAAFRLMPSLDAASPRGVEFLVKSLFFIPYAHGDGTITPILVPGWTLNYEMCFYLLFAGALILWNRRASWLAILLLATVMLTAHLFPGTTLGVFYSKNIMLEFVAGILSFHVYRSAKPEACRKLRIPLYFALLISLCLLPWYEGTQFYNSTCGSNDNRVWFIIFSYALLQSVVLIARSGHDFNNKALVLIGDASYTLYLLHLLIVSVFKHFVPRKVPLLQANLPLGSLVAIALSLVCALVVYVYLERPVHRWLNSRLLNKQPRQAPAARVPAAAY